MEAIVFHQREDHIQRIVTESVRSINQQQIFSRKH